MKPNYYAILTSEVRYNKTLTPNAKLLYAEITALINMNGDCFASNKYFADLYGKSKTTVSKWVSELVKEGFVEIKLTYKEGSKEIDNRYIRILKGGIDKKLNTPILKNLKDNNTSINNNTTYSNKKPSIDEIKDYCLERNNDIDAEQFYDFYESKNWYVGKNKMKDWRACIRTWEKRQVKTKPTSKIDQQLDSYQKAINIIKNNNEN
jgi:DNA-binding transcriptional ArsR family regulator